MAVAIVTAILLVDQVIKIWVKTNMTLHEQIEIFSWFKILFIENNGMAYGMELGSKLVLSLFRIVAVGILGWYIASVVRKKGQPGLSRLSVDGDGRGCREHLRLDVLRTDLQRLLRVLHVLLCPFRYGICAVPDGKGGGYVLLPADCQPYGLTGYRWWGATRLCSSVPSSILRTPRFP